MAPMAGSAATSTSAGGQRLNPSGLRSTAKSAALSPRVRAPQRMFSASASLGGGGDRVGVDGAVSPAVPIRTARALRAPAASNPGVSGLSSGTSLPSSAQVPVAIQPGSRSSLGSRMEGAKRRSVSGERVGNASTHGHQAIKANGSVLGPSASSVSVLEAEVGMYASSVGSNGYPQIRVPVNGVQASPAPAMLVSTNAWGMTGTLPTSQSPRVIPTLSSAVLPPMEQWCMQDIATSPMSGSIQGIPCTQGGTVVVSGIRASSSHSPNPVTAPWPRASGQRTPVLPGQGPPRFVTRSASDMGSAMPRSHVLRNAPPENNAEFMDRGAAAAAVALLAKEAQEAKLESEFLRRIEALEAKVDDRDGLLAKLSRQQARLDRLELLARENEILKAQMRGEQRREQFDRRPAPPQVVVQTAERQSSKDNRASRKLGVDRQASGRLRQEPREVKIITARDEASTLPDENGDTEARSPSSRRAAKVQRSSSSGTFSPPPPDRQALAPRRMVSAPQEFTAPSDAMKVGKKAAASSELECRLEELELALGLQPGCCTKYPMKRTSRENSNAVVRERSV